MFKNKKIVYVLALIPLIAILFLFVWFFSFSFEGEKPKVTLHPLPEYLSKDQAFALKLADTKRGLKHLKISVNQEGRDITVFEKKFPFKGFLNRQGIQQYEKELSIDPTALNLAQGRIDLNVRVWDYSRRSGGDGNLTLIQHKMIVDTIAPALRAVSRMHNINKGGSGLVVYQTSSDTVESGVFVDEIYFQGFPAQESSQKGLHVCYFAVPHDSRSAPTIYLWAKDKAENLSTKSFYTHIRKKRFRSQRMNISDRFLDKVIPYFASYPFNPEDSAINKYVKINNDLRKENHQILVQLKEKSDPLKRWEGPWLRLKKAATMARFGDRRSYYYKGSIIDEQFHLGIDLASLRNSPVQAANHGRVLYAEELGIYGLAVVIDHGQGLLSLYGHLSQIEVTSGQELAKGETIGLTGQTGLAGGDHLHFGVMVNGVLVNPIEWWDSHWLRDNVNKKLALIK